MSHLIIKLLGNYLIKFEFKFVADILDKLLNYIFIIYNKKKGICSRL